MGKYKNFLQSGNFYEKIKEIFSWKNFDGWRTKVQQVAPYSTTEITYAEIAENVLLNKNSCKYISDMFLKLESFI